MDSWQLLPRPHEVSLDDGDSTGPPPGPGLAEQVQRAQQTAAEALQRVEALERNVAGLRRSVYSFGRDIDEQNRRDAVRTRIVGMPRGQPLPAIATPSELQRHLGSIVERVERLGRTALLKVTIRRGVDFRMADLQLRHVLQGMSPDLRLRPFFTQFEMRMRAMAFAVMNAARGDSQLQQQLSFRMAGARLFVHEGLDASRASWDGWAEYPLYEHMAVLEGPVGAQQPVTAERVAQLAATALASPHMASSKPRY